VSVPTPARAGAREWIGLAVIALPCLLYAMDLTVLFLAVPALTADLDPSATQLLWITDIYGFVLAGALITMGTLGDRIGRRRLLLIGAAAFGVCSVFAAFSNSPEALIASRALLGLAGATLAPSTLSLISNMFRDPSQRRFAIGVWATCFSVGAAIGPIVGGVMLEHFWWGSVFLLAVPVMLLLLAVGPRFLPEYRDPDPGRFDLPSAGLSLVAILAVVFGIKRIAEHGEVDATALGALALGIAVGFVFIRRQRRIPDPLVPLALFARPAFSMALLGNSFGIFLVGGTFLFITQYLQLVAELSPLTAGLWLLPSAGAFVVGSMLAPLLARRFRAGLLMAAGLLVSAVGLLFLTTSVDAGGSFVDLIAASAAIDFGIAVAVTLGTDLIVGTAPPERAGVASGLSETGAELGGALGIALLGSIGAAIYRAQFEDSLVAAAPRGVAEAASDSLASAAALGERLPADVLAAAEAAFVSGFQAIAAIAAVLTLLVAATLIAVFRRAEKAPSRT
jgi:DHA2 family multidrug resistance protein-like MFS transporter